MKILQCNCSSRHEKPRLYLVCSSICTYLGSFCLSNLTHLIPDTTLSNMLPNQRVETCADESFKVVDTQVGAFISSRLDSSIYFFSFSVGLFKHLHNK